MKPGKSAAALLTSLALQACGGSNPPPAPAPSAEEAKPPDSEPASSARKASPPAAEEARVAFPEVGVSLVKSRGFRQAGHFSGLEHPTFDATVMVTLLTVPISEVQKTFTKENVESRGWTFQSIEEVQVGEQTAYLTAFTQVAGRDEYGKWAIVIGDEERSNVVVAAFPSRNAGLASGLLKRVVLSARLIPVEEEQLPFSIQPALDLKRTRAAAGGHVLMFSRGLAETQKDPGAPTFVASPSLRPMTGKSRESVARTLLSTIAHTTLRKVRSFAPIRLAELDGFVAIADAVDKGSATPLTVYQVILFSGDWYLRMLGVVGTADEKKYLPAFEKMVQSYRWTKGASEVEQSQQRQ